MDSRSIDVFLSYTSADREAVERIAKWLRVQRIEPWLDRWQLAPGGRWQEEIADALRVARACGVFIGPAGLGDWAREELGVAQDRAAKDREFRLFMVLLPGAPDPLDVSLAFLRTRSWVDLRRSLTDPDGLQELMRAIAGLPSAQTGPVEATGVCPYRGLAAFDEEHAAFFFGRTDDVKRVVEKLHHTRFLGVLGPSGSGKSSLLRAGLIPALRAGAVPDSDGWTVRVFTPGAQPLKTLAAQVVRLLPERSMARTLDDLGEDRRALDLAVTAALADRRSAERVLLIVDQFEELFTLGSDEGQQAPFLDNLLHAATVPGGRVVVVVGMRADFYHRCAGYSELAALISAEQFLVTPLDHEGLRQAIEEPAVKVGLEFEAGLVETILGDVADRPGALPLLEHVLLELWERRRGGMLTLAAYVANGGVEGALAGRANAIYEGLSPTRQELTRRVLLRLVQPGDGVEDTRRRAMVSELVSGPQEKDDVNLVVHALADQRLLATGRDEVSGSEVVEITHEALIRGWPRLRSWINEDREALRAHRRLADAATEWHEQSQDEGLLYRGARLAYWQERPTDILNEKELTFLDASRRREARDRAAVRRRVRLAVSGLTAAVLAVSTVALLVLILWRQASQERDVARSRQLAASAEGQLPIDPERALLLAIEAFAVEQTPQAEAILRQATSESRLRRTLIGHEGSVQDVTFVGNGRQILSAGEDGTLRVWDSAKWGQTVVSHGHEGRIDAAAVSPNGRMVVTAGGDDGTVRAWDLASREEVITFPGHEGGAHDAAFGPEGRYVATSGEDHIVRIWNTGESEDPSVLHGHAAPVWGVAFSPDGRHVASASDDETIRIWEWRAGRETHVFEAGSGVNRLSYSPDGLLLASAGQDGTVKVWDRDGNNLAALRGHNGSVSSVAFSPEGRRIASAGSDGTVRVWNWSTSEEALVLRGHGGYLTGAAFSPDGQQIVSASADGTARVWDAAPPAEHSVLRGHTDLVYAVEASPDGSALVSAGRDGTVHLWNTSSGTGRALGNKPGSLHDTAIHPDGRTVATIGDDGAVWLWDAEQQREPALFGERAHEGAGWGIAFSPNGDVVGSVGDDGTVRLLATQGEAGPVVLPESKGRVFTLAFSPTGRLVAAAGEDGAIFLWDRSHVGKPKVMLGHQGSVHSVVFSADGQRVISGSDDTTVRVWETATGRQLYVLRGHQGSVWAVAVADDSNLIVSAGDDGVVRVWDSAGRRLMVKLHGHSGAILDVAPLPRRHRFASTGEDGTVRVWHCEVCGPVEAVLELARARVTRDLTPEERATFLDQPPA